MPFVAGQYAVVDEFLHLRVGDLDPGGMLVRTIPGSVSVIGLRPAPGLRTRPDGPTPASSSATPCRTRDLDDPDARATAAIPP